MSLRLNLFALLLMVSFSVPSAFAARSEENAIIPVGLGASSPSYISGLGYENPAGLVMNQSTRVFGQVAVGDTDSTGAGGFILGNGGLGAGLRYSNFRSVSEAQWGIAGRFDHLSLGVSGHHSVGDDQGPYGQGNSDLEINAGLIIEASSGTRVGILLRNAGGPYRVYTGGFTQEISSACDFSLEAAYSERGGQSSFTVDPAIGFHFSPLHFSVGYAIHLSGDYDLYYKKSLFYAAGLKLGHSVMLSYEFIETYAHVITLSFSL
jgi:hypothetical protein